MSDETQATETQPADKPTKPDWLDEKFYDPDAGQPRVEELSKSYRELQGAFGRRIGDLSAEARRKLAEAIPDEMRATWADEVKSRLAEDDEFLAPLREKWAADQPKAPEEYDLAAVELPEGLELDKDHPALAKAAELAKAAGMGQEQFAQLVALGAELMGPPASFEERMAAIGDDYGPRATALVNKARAAAGADPQARAAVEAALAEMHSPEAFRGMELILAQRGEKPAPNDGGAALQAVSVDSLKEIQARSDYRERPDLQRQVREGFQRLFGDVV